MIEFGDCYRDSRVLVTGHTGFKGSWLALWLEKLGAITTGMALDPDTDPSHWDTLQPDIYDHRLDIRNADEVQDLVKQFAPDIVFHLAAQALVRRSYRDPIDNWMTNVMGTAHVLDACRHVDSVQAIVVITTDKVYQNQENARGYQEDDALGGHDPYSASKAATELLVDSYRKSFFDKANMPLLASARAGNVIGGGDWSEDRLIPDLVRSIRNDTPLVIRSPDATRPWQHVLECLAGYLQLGQKLLEQRDDFAGAWNFGPEREANRTVAEVLIALQSHWPALDWAQTDEPQPHEAQLLYLDPSKANKELAWRSVWTLDEALEKTTDWYRAFNETGKAVSASQLSDYVSAAHAAGADWVSA